MYRRLASMLPLSVCLFFAAGTVTFGQDRVVASIKPLHSLVAGVMQGVGKPYLIVTGSGSPHWYSLKPSDASALEQASVVFWIGPALESFLATSLSKLARRAQRIELAQAPQLQLLKTRRDDAWTDGDHQHEAEHAHAAIDMHIWLDPLNAKAMVAEIAAILIEIDPEHEPVYASNRDQLWNRLDALQAELDSLLAPVRDVPYLVFHDGFHYLEHRFGLQAVAAVTPSPEHIPGAERLRKIRKMMARAQIRCIFTEPQFAPKLIDVIIEGTDIKVDTLDALGADLPDGPDLYFELLRRNAQALLACLS